MKIRNINHYKPILTALKEAGFKVAEVVEQDKKTVINISPLAEQSAAPRVKANSNRNIIR